MRTKLYIIGNGFDLHHHLKTSYYDFATYLREKHNDIYTSLENYISHPTSEKDLWCRFEENLANLNVDEILSEHSDTLPNYASDDFRDRDRYVFPDIMEEFYQKLTSGVFSAFEEFIQQVYFPNYSRESKILIDKEATFLTFNYTNTLEKLYSIDKSKIIYIHNSAFYGTDNIILGHGIDPENFKEKKPEPPDSLEPEELEEWYNKNDDYEYSYDEGKQNLMRYFKETYKPTKEIILRHSTFFKNLVTVEEILVLGHSLSSIDLPYFKAIFNNIKKDVKWTVSFYNSIEHNRHLLTLNNLGIKSENIRLIELEDLQESNKQLKIQF
jgi:Bacteriophage abortive infection AbiH